MPSYDYFCPANGRVVEVRHSMSETVSTWGDVCQRAGLDLAGTPAESPVQMKLSAAAVSTGSSPAMSAPMGCGKGGCGCH